MFQVSEVILLQEALFSKILVLLEFSHFVDKLISVDEISKSKSFIKISRRAALGRPMI